MVSIRLLSLPKEYIEASRKLITLLEEANFGVVYAFWYIRYDDDQEWTDGEWRLLIASDLVKKIGYVWQYNTLRNILMSMEDNQIQLDDIELDEVDLRVPGAVCALDKIDIKTKD